MAPTLATLPTHAGARLPVSIYADSDEASAAVAAQIANLIRTRAAEGKACVLVIMILATILIGIGRALENYFARWRAGA